MCRSRLLVILFLLFGWRTARAEGATDARAHYDQATKAFALGKFAEAATEYEAAFDLKPQAALLFNAAQAHRQAGNKQRALLLYQNYLRIFLKAPNRAEVQRQVADLQQSIEAAAARPVPLPEKPPEPAPTATPTPAPAAIVEAPPQPKPLVKKGWFWGAIVGGVVVVGGAVALGVVFGSSTKDPNATLGGLKVNN